MTTYKAQLLRMHWLSLMFTWPRYDAAYFFYEFSYIGPVNRNKNTKAPDRNRQYKGMYSLQEKDKDDEENTLRRR